MIIFGNLELLEHCDKSLSLSGSISRGALRLYNIEQSEIIHNEVNERMPNLMYSSLFESFLYVNSLTIQFILTSILCFSVLRIALPQTGEANISLLIKCMKIADLNCPGFKWRRMYFSARNFELAMEIALLTSLDHLRSFWKIAPRILMESEDLTFVLPS